MPLPDLILITVDCLRADHVGFMGYGRATTPNLDRLAGESVLFASAFSTGPRTAESFPGIIASSYPLMFGGGYALTENHTTLAEVLKSAGYKTLAFHSNPYITANFGYDRGFDVFWDSQEKVSGTVRLSHRLQTNRTIRRNTFRYRLLRWLGALWKGLRRTEPFVRAEILNQKALSVLTNGAAPFFMWLHYMDPHYPYQPQESYLRLFSGTGLSRWKLQRLLVKMLESPGVVTVEERQILVDLYDSEIRYLDDSLGQLIDSLKKMGRYHNTLIILTADHGEEFGEHGEYSHATWASEVRDGRVITKLHDELIHVPLMIRFPDQRFAGQVFEGLVSLVDIAPTIADFLDHGQPEAWRGQSLLRFLAHGPEGRPFVFSEYQVHNRGYKGPVVACRTANRKYIHEGVFANHELYDLIADPAEMVNLLDTDKDTPQEIIFPMEEHLQMLKFTSQEPEEVVIDDDLRERMRALGYLE